LYQTVRWSFTVVVMLCIPKADAMHPQAAFCEIHPAKSGPQYSLNMYTIKFPLQP